MTHKDTFEQTVKLDVEAGVREGVKVLLEEGLQEEMTEYLEAGYRKLTPHHQARRAQGSLPAQPPNASAGKIERLKAPRDREGEFLTELFERYKRMTEFLEGEESEERAGFSRGSASLYRGNYPKAVRGGLRG